MFKYEIKYGILTGAGICFWILLEFLLGFHSDKMNMGEYSLYFVVIIPLITIYRGIKEKRDSIFNGAISLNGGIKTGLMISLIAAVITAVFIIVYFNFIDPGFFERGIAYHAEKLLKQKETGYEITDKLMDIKAAFSFVNQLLFGILGTVGIGFIISIIYSFVLRKNKTSI